MRILVATDGSAAAAKAVQAAGTMAQFSKGAVALLTVAKPGQHRGATAVTLQRAQEQLPAAVAVLYQRVRHGTAADEIIQEAEDGRFDLIVMGHKTVPRVLACLLPPTTARVIAQMRWPVLVAKTEMQQVERILVCESGREPSLVARLQQKLPALMSPAVSVTVLHVMSQIVAAPHVPEWQLHATAGELIAHQTPEGVLLAHDTQLLQETETVAEAKVRHGMVVEEIVAEAHNGRYDLIVIGTHRHQGWEWLLLDDVARLLVDQVQRPLLVL